MSELIRRERVRRALLYMPGDDLKKITKGAGMGVDAVIMDLEDAVAQNNKAAARQTVYEALTSGEVDFGRTERLVRLNPASTEWQEVDLQTTIQGKPDGFVLPKVESAEEVQRISAQIADYERGYDMLPGTIQLLAYIETARGVVNLREIADSDPRLSALIFGAEDLAASVGAIRTAEGWEVFYARSAVVTHAAAAGIQAIDTVYVHLGDTDGLRTATEEALRMGYAGKTAIHPGQVETITAVFTPADAEIDFARRLLDANMANQANRTGVFAFEGKMVDMPMIRAAERVMARAHAAGKG